MSASTARVVRQTGAILYPERIKRQERLARITAADCPDDEVAAKAKKAVTDISIRLLLRANKLPKPEPESTSLPILTAAKKQAMNLMCRIYIGSINFTVDENMLRAAFSPFGPIRAVNLSIDLQTGKHKGFCFLEFETPEAAFISLGQMNGVILGERNLKVGRPSNMPQADPLINQLLDESKKSPRIYVGSIPISINQDDLRKIFAVFGEITSIKMSTNPAKTSEHNGFAYISYSDIEEAESAVKSMNLFNLMDKYLRVGRVVTPEFPEEDETLDTEVENTAQQISQMISAKMAALDSASTAKYKTKMSIEMDEGRDSRRRSSRRRHSSRRKDEVIHLRSRSRSRRHRSHRKSRSDRRRKSHRSKSRDRKNSKSDKHHSRRSRSNESSHVSKKRKEEKSRRSRSQSHKRSSKKTSEKELQDTVKKNDKKVEHRDSKHSKSARDESTKDDAKSSQTNKDNAKNQKAPEKNSPSATETKTETTKNGDSSVNLASQEAVHLLRGSDERQLHMHRLLRKREQRTLQLANIVEAREVDDDFKLDIEEECNRHARVSRVVINIQKSSTEDALDEETEKVYIFVELESNEDAKKLLSVMDNRFFAGRRISAKFYDQELSDQNYFKVYE